VTHLIGPLFELLLRWFGIDEKRALPVLFVLCFALFAFHAGRRLRAEPMQSLTYLIGTLGLLSVLFSGTPRRRIIGAAAFAGATVILFARYFLRRRLARRPQP
jgi:hypothetical protein